MKTKAIAVIYFFILVHIAHAELVYNIYEDTVFPENFVYDGIVRVYDSATGSNTLQVQSGYINFLTGFDNSNIINYGSGVNMCYARNNSTISIYGGEAGWLHTFDSSLAIIDGGSVREGIISENYSQIDIVDGSSYWLRSFGNSEINLYNATLGFMGAHEESVINVYGYDLYKASTGGNGYGYVAGTWSGGTSFYIPFFDEGTYDNVILHVVPAPAAFPLAVLGGLFLRIIRKYS